MLFLFVHRQLAGLREGGTAAREIACVRAQALVRELVVPQVLVDRELFTAIVAAELLG